jgi:hypothetical protein
MAGSTSPAAPTPSTPARLALAIVLGMVTARRCYVRVAGFLVVATMLLAGCQATPPDRRADADRLTQQLGGMPGVHAVHDEVVDKPAQGLVYFSICADLTDDITSGQLGDIVTRYLAGLAGGDYGDYQAEFDARQGANLFAVDSGRLPVANRDQIVTQARDWAAMRHGFPSATISLRATITHPRGQLPVQEWGHSNRGAIDLPDTADYTSVSATVAMLANRFAGLSSLDWTISAGKEHPADIKTSRRLPNARELQVWNRINADQSIAHIDKMTINGRARAPVWVSEKTIQSRALTVALQLARRHLPVVAALPAPVLYTASDTIQGHIGFYGQSKGPVAVTIGGCTPRDYFMHRPTGAELALINTYETCRR